MNLTDEEITWIKNKIRIEELEKEHNIEVLKNKSDTKTKIKNIIDEINSLREG